MYASKAYIKHTFLQACRRYVRPVILYAWGDIHELKCMLESIHFTFSKLGKIFTQTVALVVNFVNCCQLTTYNRSYKAHCRHHFLHIKAPAGTTPSGKDAENVQAVKIHAWSVFWLLVCRFPMQWGSRRGGIEKGRRRRHWKALQPTSIHFN